MIIPAIVMKHDIEEQFNALAYTDTLLYYNGCIENCDHKIQLSDYDYAYAIVTEVNSECHLVGYVAYHVDFYERQAYQFGLICFDHNYHNVVTSAILEIIRKLKSMNLHRIEFRCIEGNPAEVRYRRLINKIPEYVGHELRLTDTIKDREGNYHDSLIFELIKND